MFVRTTTVLANITFVGALDADQLVASESSSLASLAEDVEAKMKSPEKKCPRVAQAFTEGEGPVGEFFPGHAPDFKTNFLLWV